MVTRTFVSKCNTITNGSKENFGLNPVCSLNYGKRVSRILVYFDEEDLKGKVSDKTYKDRSKLTHRLKMTNCGSIDPKKFFEDDEIKEYLTQKHRAASFDVIAFRIPKTWDAGKGFDDSTDTWFLGYKSVSKDGSTWENAMSGAPWAESGTNFSNGIYASDFLSKEYEKWGQGEPSVVIGRQHFDYGNESIDIDITDFVNSILFDGAKNYGLCLAFSPRTEETVNERDNYVSFFTNNTNTFFAPYVETRYDAQINDCRYKFYLGKKNRLYFYAIAGGEFIELDELPKCEINGVFYDVSSDTKGIYYVEVKLPKNAKENAVMSDVWSNIKLDGDELEDVDLDFVTLPYKNFFNYGEEIEDNVELNPVISGINDDQKLNQGEIRELNVIFKVPYTSSEYELVDKAYYRIYVKDGKREIDVIDWDNINSVGRKNMITLNTGQLAPQDYYVDIKAVIGRQTLMFKNKLHFKVVDNVTSIKR